MSPPTVLTAEDTSIDLFLSVSASSPYQEQLQEYTQSLLQMGCTRPSWCLLGMQSDLPVARAALWASRHEAVPSDVVLIDADWEDPTLANGHALLATTHGQALALGAKRLRHHIDTPAVAPQFQENPSARTRLLAEAGYELQRDGLRWLYTSSSDQERPAETSLSFRGLPEIGEDRFIEAIAATYEGTRDSMLSRHVREHGLVGAARSDFRDYQELDYQPSWWQLALTGDAVLAGVIMAARTSSSAVIAYVGVVPAQRGRGLAPELVRFGTEQLLAGGVDEIRGDCDRDNIAMAKAFQRAGYHEVARRRTYEVALAA